MSNCEVHLHTVREGNGPLVVLSHALGCDLSMWDGVAAELAPNYTVLRYDHRNHGSSEVMAGALSMDVLADDAAALIKREAQGRPVHFVGLSMGGMTAQALALRHGHLLQDIVIANSAAHYPEQLPWKNRVQSVAAQGIASIADGAVDRWLTHEWRTTTEGAKARAALRDTLLRNDPAGYAASCNAVAAIDFRQSNQLIRVPALVIAGTQDEATPMAMSEHIALTIDGAKLAVLDVAHLSAVERPREFAALLVDFWNNAALKA